LLNRRTGGRGVDEYVAGTQKGPKGRALGVQTNNEFQFLLSEVNRVCGGVFRTLIEYDENAKRLRVASFQSQPRVRRARLYVVPTFAGTLT